MKIINKNPSETRFQEAKPVRPSSAKTKWTKDTHTATFKSAGGFDGVHMGTYEGTETYTHSDTTGYILDKNGNKYDVSARTREGDSGYISGGARDYYVTIYLTEDRGISFHGYSALFSTPHGTNIISDLEHGYYLEDYIARNAEFMSVPSELKEIVAQLKAAGNKDALSYDGLKAKAVADKGAKFDTQYVPITRTSAGEGYWLARIQNGKVQCYKKDYVGSKNPDGSVREDPYNYEDIPFRQTISSNYDKETSKTTYEYYELEGKTQLNEVIARKFNINGYTVADFEGVKFEFTLIEPSYRSSYTRTYGFNDSHYLALDTKSNKLVLVEVTKNKQGNPVREVKEITDDYFRINSINLASTDFSKLVLEAYQAWYERKWNTEKAEKIAAIADRIYSDPDNKRYMGYWDNHRNPNYINKSDALYRAKSEYSSYLSKAKQKTSVTWEEFTETVKSMPAGGNEKAAEVIEDKLEKEDPVKTAVVKKSRTGTPVKLDQEVIDKMTAWHNGTRRQNVGACSDAKLKTNYKACKQLGFEKEAEILKKEAEARNLDFTNI